MTAKIVLQPDDYVKAYEVARAGGENQHIAAALNLGMNAFRRLRDKDDDLLEKFITAGRNKSSENIQAGQFIEYVHQRLSEPLRDIWNEIRLMDDAPNGPMLIMQLMSNLGERARQNLFLHALVYHNFNTSRAMTMVCVSQFVLKRWARDPEFKALWDEIIFHKKNFFEGALLDMVAARDIGAVLFCARTQLRDRGYDDRRTIDINATPTVADGELVSLDLLDMSTDQRKALLQKHRELKQENEAISSTGSLKQLTTIEATARIIDQ